MDIEGAEMAALHGMKKLLKRNPQLKIITEFLPALLKAFGYSPRKYLEELTAMGYHMSLINEKNGKVEPISIDEALKEADTISENFSRLAINLYLEK